MDKKFIILIPSRIGSTRLKNKPLAKIGSMSLIQRVYMNAINLSENTYIATDSKEIQSHALSFTNKIVMTSPDHISGTDRICEAAGYLDINDEDLVINLQGDEPFMPLDLITNIINDFYTNDCDVISACHPIDKDNDVDNPNCVKAILNENNYAITFQRKLVNHENKKIMRHIGLYAYSYKVLKELVSLKPSKNEIDHKLEQLRFLDNGYSIFLTEYKNNIPPGIDTEDDLIIANKFLESL